MLTAFLELELAIRAAYARRSVSGCAEVHCEVHTPQELSPRGQVPPKDAATIFCKRPLSILR